MYAYTPALYNNKGDHLYGTAETIINEQHAFEVLSLPEQKGFKPYFDYDPIYPTEQASADAWQADVSTAVKAVEALYPAPAQLYVFGDRRYITSKTSWKNSVHVIVDGAGYYEQTSDIPKLEGFDHSPYKPKGSRQLMRAPYSAKEPNDQWHELRMSRLDYDNGVWTSLTYEDTGILDEDPARWLIQNIQGLKPIALSSPASAAPVPAPSVSPGAPKSTGSVSIDRIYTLSEMITDTDERDTWRNLVWACANIADLNGYDLREVAHKMAAKSDKYDASATDKLYDTAKENGCRLGFNYLRGVAREQCPQGFDAMTAVWKMEWHHEQFEEQLRLLSEWDEAHPGETKDAAPEDELEKMRRAVFSDLNDDHGFASTLLAYPVYKGRVIAYDDTLYVYDKWWQRTDAAVIREALSGWFYADMLRTSQNLYEEAYNEERKRLDAEKLKVKDEELKTAQGKRNKLLKRIRNASSKNGVVATVYDICKLPTGVPCPFGVNNDLLGFNDGTTYDLLTGTARPMTPEDMIADVVPYAYDANPPADRIAKVNAMIAQIMPQEDERKFLLTALSTGLDGHVTDKIFIFKGAGRNGKDTLCTKLLRWTLGDDLWYNQSPGVVCSNMSKGGPNQEVASMGRKRAVVVSEPSAKQTLDCATLKAITGTDTINARAIYSKETRVPLNLSLFILVNDTPALDVVDEAIRDRITVLEFRSLFKDADEVNDPRYSGMSVYPKDKCYVDPKWCRDHAPAFMHILLKHYPLWRDGGAKGGRGFSSVPPSVLAARDAYITESSELMTWFIGHYEPASAADWVKVKDAHDLFKESDIYENMTKTKRSKKAFVEMLTKHPAMCGLYRAGDQNGKIVDAMGVRVKAVARVVGWRRRQGEEDDEHADALANHL